MMAGKLLTNVQRMHRKFTSDSSCFHCPGTPETLLHLFRDYPKAIMVWESCHMAPITNITSPLDWHGWLSSNLLQTCRFNSNTPWNIVFTFICWHIWKWRCKCIFDSSFNLPYNMRNIIADYIKEWNTSNKAGHKCCPKKPVSMHWTMPPVGFLKINVDGTQDRNGNIAAAGVMRNSDGSWCGGFMSNLGSGSIDQAEAWGILHGLQMASNFGAQKIELECDSANVVNLFHQEDNPNHPLGIIIHNCKSLIQNFITCLIRHVHREKNTVADIMAKSSLVGAKGISWLDDAPLYITNALLDDIAGVSRLRSIPDADPSDTNPEMHIGASSSSVRHQAAKDAPIMLQNPNSHLDADLSHRRPDCYG